MKSIEIVSDEILELEGLTENRIHALKSLAMLMLNELKLLENLSGKKTPVLPDKAISLADEVENFEIDLIRLALARAKGNQRTAARILKTKTSTLSAKIKRFGIQPQGLTLVAGGRDL